MSSSKWIRPAWTPVTITLLVLGFMASWALGLLVLAYIVWGDRLQGFTDDMNRAVDRMVSGFRQAAPASTARTGNVAFDEWRDAELQRLQEERRRLDETRREFDDYVRELRRAKDREQFEEFMARRDAQKRERAGRAGYATGNA